MENNRIKERVFYMSCFDRFTKLKRNDEIEVSVPLISFAIWQNICLAIARRQI